MTQERSCGTCTKCCEGWLPTTIHGKEVKVGSPCQYVSLDGCSIYADRPVNPCVKFKCVWLADEEVPDWVKPENSGVIAQIIKQDIVVTPAGQTVSSEYSTWAKAYSEQHALRYIEEQ